MSDLLLHICCAWAVASGVSNSMGAGLMQISGEDINSPRQSFVCEAQRDPAFRNLVESTWALIAHEWRSTVDPQNGLFSAESVKKWPGLNERVRVFALEGRKL